MRFTSAAQRKAVMASLRGHVYQLAKSRRIKVLEIADKMDVGAASSNVWVQGNVMKRYGRTITIPKIDSRKQYFTALHELGHLMGSFGGENFGTNVVYKKLNGLMGSRRLPPNAIFRREANAWRFAHSSAIIKPTTRDVDRMARMLSTYEGVPYRAKLSPAGHKFRKWAANHIKNPPRVPKRDIQGKIFKSKYPINVIS